MYKFQDQMKAVEGVRTAGLLAHKESFVYSVLCPGSCRFIGFIPTNGELCFTDYSDHELAPYRDKIGSMIGLLPKL